MNFLKGGVTYFWKKIDKQTKKGEEGGVWGEVENGSLFCISIVEI